MVARLFLCALALVATPASAVGKLGVLPTGRYVCELPGDATGPASRPVKGQWFEVINASSYRTEAGEGTYLMTGDEIVFTRGPMHGARFKRTGARALRRLDLGGDLAMLRCVRTARGTD